MKILKITPLMLAILLVAACSQGSDDSLESKKKKLETYKEELAELTGKIDNLEAEILKIEDSTGVEIPTVAVRVMELQAGLFRHPIDLQGVVESDQNVLISPEVGGIIKDILVKEGERLTINQKLATIDSELLDNQIAEVKIAFDLANTTYQRQKNLWDKNIGSEMQYLQAKNQRDALEKQMTTLQAQKSKYTVRSTINGSVDEVFVNQGEMIGPGSPLARVVDARNVKITADVSEKYLGKFNLNDTVSVQFPAVGRSTTGRIKAIGQVIHPGNRTFKITIHIENPDGFYKPNLLAVIAAYDEVKPNTLMVPTRLVELIGDKTFILIAEPGEEDTIAKRVEIETGKSALGKTVVTAGLNGGEWIITEGNKSATTGDLLNIITE